MKVGILAEFGSPDIGGVHRASSELFHSFLEMARESHHTFVVFVAVEEKGHFHISPDHNLKVVYYSRSGWIRKLHDAFELGSALMRALTDHREAFEPAHHLERLALENGVEFMWFMGQTFAPMRVPYLYTVLDVQHWVTPWFPEFTVGRQWQGYEDVLSRMIPRAAILVTSSPTVKSHIERFYRVPGDRIHVIPYPTPRFALEAPPSRNGTAVLAKYGLRDVPSYLFYPSQFWTVKNHANLLHALRILHEKHGLALHLVLAGSDKGTMAYIRRLSRDLRLDGYVHILKFIPLEDLIELYRHALALTYPSFAGPDNLPSLEALALGCPVIASPEPGVSEQLGEAVLAVDPKSAEDIASKIRRLHGEPELRKRLIEVGSTLTRGLTGRRYFARAFSILDDFEPIRRAWR